MNALKRKDATCVGGVTEHISDSFLENCFHVNHQMDLEVIIPYKNRNEFALTLALEHLELSFEKIALNEELVLIKMVWNG